MLSDCKYPYVTKLKKTITNINFFFSIFLSYEIHAAAKKKKTELVRNFEPEA